VRRVARARCFLGARSPSTCCAWSLSICCAACCARQVFSGCKVSVGVSKRDCYLASPTQLCALGTLRTASEALYGRAYRMMMNVSDTSGNVNPTFHRNLLVPGARAWADGPAARLGCSLAGRTGMQTAGLARGHVKAGVGASVVEAHHWAEDAVYGCQIKYSPIVLFCNPNRTKVFDWPQ
jgi:hypothetical protein